MLKSTSSITKLFICCFSIHGFRRCRIKFTCNNKSEYVARHHCTAMLASYNVSPITAKMQIKVWILLTLVVAFDGKGNWVATIKVFFTYKSYVGLRLKFVLHVVYFFYGYLGDELWPLLFSLEKWWKPLVDILEMRNHTWMSKCFVEIKDSFQSI